MPQRPEGQMIPTVRENLERMIATAIRS